MKNGLIELYETQGQFAKAEPLYRQDLERIRLRTGESSVATAGALAALGLNLLVQGKCADAEPLVRQCLSIRETEAPDDWTTFNTKSMLGGALLGQKRYADAEPLLLAGYDGMKAREEKLPPAGKLRVTESIERLAELYDKTGRTDEAAKWRSRLPLSDQEPGDVGVASGQP